MRLLSFGSHFNRLKKKGFPKFEEIFKTDKKAPVTIKGVSSNSTNNNSNSGSNDSNSNSNKDSTVVDLYNARSWNKETHPNGIGDSYWVAAIHWDSENKLLVRFRDGFKAQYNVSSEIAKELVKADSKGRYVWFRLKDLPYTEYKGGIV